MYLFKRGSRYYLAFDDEEGKQVRVSAGCRLKSDATEFLRKFKLEERLKQVKREQKTLDEFVREFVRHSSCQHTPKTTIACQTAGVQSQRTVGIGL